MEAPLDVDADASDNEDTPVFECSREYLTWKKNAGLLYDTVLTHHLDFPSLTVQWCGNAVTPEGSGFSSHKLVMGTHAPEGDQNRLIIADVRLPNGKQDDRVPFDEERKEHGGYGGSVSVSGKVKEKMQINYDGEVNCARVMPQDHLIIATKSNTDALLVFDVTKHPTAPPEGGRSEPQHRCLGHAEEGFPLAWNPHTKGQLLSAANDGSVCLWDICGAAETVETTSKVEGAHDAAIGGVDWHKHHHHLFATCSDDKAVKIWDARELGAGRGAKAKASVTAHEADVNAVQFSPFSQTQFVTGSADGSLKVWDLRNLSSSIHTLSTPVTAGAGGEGGADAAGVAAVATVQYHAGEEGLLASACGNAVHVWDLCRMGAQQTAEEARLGPPELRFTHCGHQAPVSDIAWNLDSPGMVASVAEDSALHVWQVAAPVLAA